MRRLVRSALVALGCLVATGTLLAQSGEDSSPNENLVTDGVPKIPREVVAQVASYTEFRGAALSSWHPTRREMLIATRFADTAQIHRVKFPGGDRKQITFFKDRVSRAVFPRRGDGEWFVFQRDVGGGEFYQSFRFDLASGGISLLSDGKSRNSLGPFSLSGLLAYSSTRRNGKDADLYVQDPKDPSSDRRIAELEGSWGPLDWSPEGDRLLASEFRSAQESYLWVFDLKAGTRKPLLPLAMLEMAGPVSFGAARFSKDGKGVYTTTDLDNETHQLAHVDVATQKLDFLLPKSPWEVESFDVSADGKTIAYIANEDGTGVLHLLDVETRKEREAPALTGTVGGVSFRENANELGFDLTSARSPVDVYSLDLDSKKVERWTESETGGLDTSAFPEPELVKWKSFDGRTISGLLYKPPARFTGKRPVVVSIHGGPEGQARPGFLGKTNYFLNELGVAWLMPNVRGSSGYGKSFMKLDDGKKREDSVKDIGALLDWIPSRPDLDAERVMVVGGSYGGYMSLACSTHFADRIRCSIDVVGISNFVSFLERTEAYRRDLRRAEYGDERDPEMRKFLEQISPLTSADKIRKPLFVVQGKNDPRVPLAEAEQIVAAVKKNGTPVWYLMAKDEGHGFQKKKNADFQFYATVMFMRKFLLD